jgi:hypothetical protein
MGKALKPLQICEFMYKANKLSSSSTILCAENDWQVTWVYKVGDNFIWKSAILMNETIEYIATQKFGNLNSIDWMFTFQITCQKRLTANA